MIENLKQLPVGGSAVITEVGGDGALRQHFLDMGVLPGAEVTVIKLAPMGDPMELQIHGYELTLRLADAEKIKIKEITERTNKSNKINRAKKTAHPGLGEGGKFHTKGDGDPLPEGTTITFALMGNQNCGKTTLFNALTGSNQHVGNFPGVTVDSKSGQIKGHPNTAVVDLPGIYSMSPYSSEEIVSRNFVLDNKPNGIINIVDATNIERNMYLTMQLLELGIPMVVALNMMDEVLGNNGSIYINELEEELGVPVIPISAIRGEGIDEVISHAVHVAKYQEKPVHQDLCDKNDHDGAIHRAIHAVQHAIEDHAEDCGIPSRFATTKIIEGDKIIEDKLNLDQNEKEMIEHIIVQMENESGMDRSAAMADMRYDFIMRVCDQTVVKPHASKERVRSEKMDSILTGKWTAIPCFIGIMGLVFYLTFNVIGLWLQNALADFISLLTVHMDALLTSAHVNEAIHGLIINGIFEGVGSVLSFLPIVVTLFFFLSIMEDSGYIARVAFVMDKILRKLGLSGRSIVPLLIGFGCTVPAVMSTRTLPSTRDRMMTILLTPFMSCSAKLPVYAFFVSAFFPGHGGLIMTGLYVLGILVGIIIALLYRKTLFKGEAVPFVMELPNYRMPSAKNVLMLLWDKAKEFITRAFTIILVATVVVWFLQSFDLKLNLVSDSSESMMALCTNLMVPVFEPLGMGDWRIITSLISGFIAKESVIATMELLFPAGITAALTAASAGAMLVFSLLYTPCVAAIATIRRELGGKWAFGIVIWQCVIAWLCAFIVKIILTGLL